MTFLITRATPGDPVQIMLGMQTSPEAAAAMRAEFNLDKPLPVQYALWVAKVATGDLGRSLGCQTEGQDSGTPGEDLRQLRRFIEQQL